MRSLQTLALGLTLGLTLIGAAAPAAARDRARQRAEPTPAWATAEGREAARLDLVIALLEAGRPEEALELTAQLRRDGARGHLDDGVQPGTRPGGCGQQRPARRPQLPQPVRGAVPGHGA